LPLQGGYASRSFAGMRVEAVGEMPSRTGIAGVTGGDGGAGLAIKNFLAAIESDASLFCIAQPLAGPSADESAGGVYFGDIVIEFRQDDLKNQRKVHFLLMEKLIELLKEAGSAESLEATLCLTSRSILASASAGGSGSQAGLNQKELVLWMRLAAKGVSTEQAVLRWGLGLAHLQQALLFTSRYLRLQLGQMGG
jgi:hypothetical protein